MPDNLKENLSDCLYIYYNTFKNLNIYSCTYLDFQQHPQNIRSFKLNLTLFTYTNLSADENYLKKVNEIVVIEIRYQRKKSGMALTQLSLTLHYN